MAGKFKPYLSAGLIATGSVAVLALYTGDSWLDPMTPALVGLVGILPLSIAGALLLHPEARSAPSRFLLLALTLVAGAVIGAGLPALWMLPDTRIAALDGAFSMVDAHGALEDPSEKVRLHACQKMITGATGLDEIARALAGRPRFANQCIQATGGAERANLLAASLQDNWHDRLLADRAQKAGSEQCLYAPELASLPTIKGSKQTDLLDCALRSPDQQRRTCCAESLAAITDSCGSLAGNLDAEKLIRTGAASTLAAISFGEANANREHAELTNRVDLECERMQLVSVQLACIGLSSSSKASDDAQTVLNWLIDESSGCLSRSEREQRGTPAEVCSGLMDTIEKRGKIDRDMVCETHQDLIQERQALLEDLKGLDAEESAQLAAQISAGDAQASDQMLNLEQFAAAAQRGQGDKLLESYSKEQAMKMMQQARQQAMSPEEAATRPFQALQEVQAAVGTKLAGNDKLQEALDEEGGPKLDDVDNKVEEGMGQIENAGGRLKGEMSKAKHQHARDK